MKQLCITLLFVLSFSFSFATKITFSVSAGDWGTAANWNLQRLPANKDTIIIPTGKTVTLKISRALSGVCIQVYGQLNITNQLFLDETSSVYVLSAGLIYNHSTAQLRIGNVLKLHKTETIQGPMYASAATSSSPYGFAPYVESGANSSTGTDRISTLPVKFIHFSVAKKEEGAQVSWATSEEINADYYLLECSANGREWKRTAKIMAVGNSSVVNNYAYFDKSTSGTTPIYYRIKQVDVDGSFTYTSVRMYQAEHTTTHYTIASTTNGNILVKLPEATKGNLMVHIYSLNGVLVAKQSISPATQFTLNRPQVSKGVYLVSIVDGAGSIKSKQVAL